MRWAGLPRNRSNKMAKPKADVQPTEIEPTNEPEAPVEVDLELDEVKAQYPNATAARRVFSGAIRVDF